MRHRGIKASREAGSDESAAADEEDPGLHQGMEASSKDVERRAAGERVI